MADKGELAVNASVAPKVSTETFDHTDKVIKNLKIKT